MTHYVKCADGSTLTIRTKNYHCCTARTEPEDWRSFALVDALSSKNMDRRLIERVIATRGGEV